jgi:hypothetical protein
MSGSSDPRHYSPVALIPLKCAKAMRKREQREAEKAGSDPKPNKNGWFG